VLSPRDPNKQRAAFKTVPKTLDLAYTEVMERIESSERSGDKALALKIFSWLYHAMRNLSMDELLEALAVDNDDDMPDHQWESGSSNPYTDSDSDSDSGSDLDLGEMPEDGERHFPFAKLKPTDVVECCKGLVLHEPGGLVRFIHDTVRVFVGKNLKSELPSELNLAKTCLTYLMFPEFEEPCLDYESMKKRTANYKLGVYAGRFWGIHVGKFENLLIVQEAALKFLTQQNKRNSMLQMGSYNEYGDLFTRAQYLLSTTLLHVIAKNGLVKICSLVLCGGLKTDDGYVLTSRTQSVDCNRKLSLFPILSTLHREETDLNATDGDNLTPLGAAAQVGHREIVQLLLDQGADINARSLWPYGTALQVASANGSESMVQLLLNHGAEVNLSGGHFSNALQAASAVGHESVVQLLLNHGADINLTGGSYGNALQAASAIGHESVVQLLLNHGAEVNLSGGHFGNALQAASAIGHESVVQLLLNHGAVVNLSGGHFGNALQAASAVGHESVVQLLLNHGADINFTGGLYGNALKAASTNCHESLVQLLRKHTNSR
jgi:ankyrin repeat protein